MVFTCIVVLVELILLFLSSVDILGKYTAEQTAKQAAIQRCDEAEHQVSMLELDLKNSRDETAQLKQELVMAVSKVCAPWVWGDE